MTIRDVVMLPTHFDLWVNALHHEHLPGPGLLSPRPPGRLRSASCASAPPIASTGRWPAAACGRHGRHHCRARRLGGRHTRTISPAGEHRYERITSIRQVIPYRRSGPADRRGAERGGRDRQLHRHRSGYYLNAQNQLDGQFPRPRRRPPERARQGQTGRHRHAALWCHPARACASGAGKLTLLNCDNLRHNGDRSRRLQFIRLIGDVRAAAWDRWPTPPAQNAMVDRITPRPRPTLRPSV